MIEIRKKNININEVVWTMGRIWGKGEENTSRLTTSDDSVGLVGIFARQRRNSGCA